jgi:transcriptional regulator with XRE-family HTH domain
MQANGRRKLDKKTLNAIGRRLREWQERKGYTSRNEFAEKCGIPASTLKAWCTNVAPKSPDVASLMDLAEKEGMSLNWLLFGEGPELLGESSRTLSALASDVARFVAIEAVLSNDDIPKHWRTTFVASLDGAVILERLVDAVKEELSAASSSFDKLSALAYALSRTRAKGVRAALQVLGKEVGPRGTFTPELSKIVEASAYEIIQQHS